jgi:hypothetical protein
MGFAIRIAATRKLPDERNGNDLIASNLIERASMTGAPSNRLST